MMFATWIPPHEAELRLDASFYTPSYVAASRCVNACNRTATFEKIRDSKRPISYGVLKPKPVSTGVFMIRNTDFDAPGIDLGKVVRISQSQSNEFRRSIVKAGDLLITIGGYVGTSAVVTTSLDGANINQHIARVSVDRDIADPYFYWAFVASKTGTLALERWVSGTAQPGINLGDLKALPIPWPDIELQRCIGSRVRKAERLRELAEDAQTSLLCWLSSATESESLGDKELEFLDQIPAKTCSDKAWITNFDLADRMDPWPHHVAPRTIRRHLSQLEQTKSFSEFFEVITEGRPRINPPLATNCYHLSILDVDAGGRIDWDNAARERYDGMGISIRAGDILYSTLNPQETRIAYISANPSATIAASPEFSILRLKEKFTDYPYLTTAVLRSNWVRLQASFLTRSSSLSRRRLAEDDFTKILVPWNPTGLGDLEEKLAIASDAYVQAGTLVEQAKCDVEALISNTLDLEILQAESSAIETWLAANPSPAAKSK